MAKREKSTTEGDDDAFKYDTTHCVAIAHPMASKKLTKRVLKLIRKGTRVPISIILLTIMNYLLFTL